VQYSLHQVSKLSTANRSCIKVKYSATSEHDLQSDGDRSCTVRAKASADKSDRKRPKGSAKKTAGRAKKTGSVRTGARNHDGIAKLARAADGGKVAGSAV
jgi:hypothetical protein